MAQVLQYSGSAHRRIIEPVHLNEVGFDYPTTLVFDTQDLRYRGQALVTDDEVAEWLVAHDTFVRVEGMAVAPLLRAEVPVTDEAAAPAEPVSDDVVVSVEQTDDAPEDQ